MLGKPPGVGYPTDYALDGRHRDGILQLLLKRCRAVERDLRPVDLADPPGRDILMRAQDAEMLIGFVITHLGGAWSGFRAVSAGP